MLLYVSEKPDMSNRNAASSRISLLVKNSKTNKQTHTQKKVDNPLRKIWRTVKYEMKKLLVITVSKKVNKISDVLNFILLTVSRICFSPQLCIISSLLFCFLLITRLCY